jgi:adenine-specific DNA-methyltransferase
MSHRTVQSVNIFSTDVTRDRLDQLRHLIPEAFAESQIDFDKLRAVLGDYVNTRPERYTFTWAGKRDAVRLMQTPTSATLIPTPKESINWDTTNHLFIEGDNLEVLKLHYKAYFGRVKMIYIDPPYNTGNDFVYPDDYTDPLKTYLQVTGQKDANGNLLSSNTNSSGRYHSNWLTMMYPRLAIARQLLREDGVIFVSIGEQELGNLLLLMNEIFGEENQESIITWRRRHNQPNDKTKMIAKVSEYIVVYARNSEYLKYRQTFYGLPLSSERQSDYSNPDNDPRGPWTTNPWKAARGRGGSTYTITTPTSKTFHETWYGNEATFKQLLKEGRVHFTDDGNGYPRIKIYLDEIMKKGQPAINFMPHGQYGSNQEASAELADLLGEPGIFNNPKPVRLMKVLARLVTSGDDIVLDFFAGSATLAQAVLELNHEDNERRRFILIQLPEPTSKDSLARKAGYKTIADISKERIRRVISRLQQEGGSVPTSEHNEDLGFRVFKLAPSHFRPWQGSPEADAATYNQQLDLFRDPLKDGWQLEAVIWEVALKEGYPLTSRITPLNIASYVSYHVANPDNEQQFHICLEDRITMDLPRRLSLDKNMLFICQDVALDDTLAANLALQCRLKTI